MKSIVCFLLCLTAALAQAQITIVSSDLPNSSTIATRSTATPFAGMDVTLTGPNYTWDYTQLTPTGQQVDSFFPETAGNPLLSLYFSNSGFNPNRSNHSSPGQDFTLGTTVSLTNVFNYYYNSTSSYQQTGIGAEVNGVPLPITFSPHDRIYALPMTFGQQDSVTFQYGIDLTSTLGLFYNVRKTRTNIVDGWGTVMTPFQNYNCLRVKSRIVEIDSIYIDSLGFGFATPPITTYEYKWLATGERVPVLQINTAANASTVTGILYKDSPVGISSPGTASLLRVFPNPANSILNVGSGEMEIVSVQIFDTRGRVVFSRETNWSGNLAINSAAFPEGNYFLKSTTSKGASLVSSFRIVH